MKKHKIVHCEVDLKNFTIKEIAPKEYIIVFPWKTV